MHATGTHGCRDRLPDNPPRFSTGRAAPTLRQSRIRYISMDPDLQPSAGTDPVERDPSPDETLSWFTVFRSAASAAFGVQSGDNQKRDFRQASVVRFLVAGIGVSAVLVFGLVIIVTVVVS